MASPDMYRSTTAKQGGKGKEEKRQAQWEEEKSKPQWEEIEYEKGAMGGIGAVYTALAEGSKDLVDFDVAVERHKIVEAIFRSAESGRRETF